MHSIMKMLVTQLCPTFCKPMDCMQPARLFCPWDFSGKNTGVGSFPSPDLPNPGTEPGSPAL